MKAKMIKEILRRAEGWPESAQADLAQAALEIERELQQDTYTATPEEVAAIERGLRESEWGKFATDAEVEAVLGKYRRSIHTQSRSFI
jgi:predicted transcriptional regulator